MILEQYRQRQAEKQRAKEAKQQAAENQAYLTDQAAQMLAEYRRKQEEKQRQRGHDRDGPEPI